MKLYACARCGSVYTHDGECNTCGNDEFAGLSVGGGDHECDECDRTFESKAALASHKRSHED